MQVLKRDGRFESFSPEKIVKTLKRSGFLEAEAREIAEEVSREAFDGIKTHQLLKIVKRKIRQRKPGLVNRYDLKRALFSLGPAGYPFEDFLSRLYLRLGYQVKVRQLVKGKCAIHEIDLVLEGRGGKAMVEAKFRSNGKGKVEIKEALCTFARLIDLKEVGFTQGFLVTNARFTSEVIAYADCCGLNLLSWDYPSENNLARLVEQNKLYPLTILTGHGSRLKKGLLEAGIMLLDELVQFDTAHLREKGFREEEIDRLKSSAFKVLKANH